jgi:uncharacterized protein (DUF2384 family)
MQQQKYDEVMIQEPQALYVVAPAMKVLKSGKQKIHSEETYRQLLQLLELDDFNLEAFMDLLGIDRYIMAESLGITDTTMWRIIKGKAKLDKNAFYRLQQLLDLVYFGIETFDYITGDFIQWMHTRQNSFKDRTPLEVFINEALGHQIIKDQLLRIEHGVFA